MSPHDDTHDSSEGLDELGRLVDRAAAGEDAEALLQGKGQKDVVRGLEALRGALEVRPDEVDAVLDEETVVPDVSGITPELPEDFELLGELGRGGMGVVYRARQRSLDRTVAIKVLAPGELLFGHALKRFHREAKTLAKLRHPHIVSVHEVGTTAGRLWFSMDFVAGESLDERLEKRPLSPSQTVRLMKQVVGAVAYVHSHGVIHRDLKPANILLDEAGDAFVTDFGLALEVDAEASLTQTGQVLGTPAWMAPEQARGKSEAIGEGTDIYGLGALMYACLCGKAPIEGANAVEQVMAVLRGDQVPLRKRNPHLPPDLIRIAEKALAVKPEHRYGSARAMLEDLERFEAGKAVRAQPPAPTYRIGRALARHRTLLLGLAVGVVLGIGALLALGADRDRDESERLLALGTSMLVDEDFRAAERVADDVEVRLGDPAGDDRAERLFARARLLKSRALIGQDKLKEADAVLADAHERMHDATPTSWEGAPFVLLERAALSHLLGQRTHVHDFRFKARHFAEARLREMRGGLQADRARVDALLIEERPAFLDRPRHPLHALSQRWLQVRVPSAASSLERDALWPHLETNPQAHVGAIHAVWVGEVEAGRLLKTRGVNGLRDLSDTLLDSVATDTSWPDVVRRSAALILAVRWGAANAFVPPGALSIPANADVDVKALVGNVRTQRSTKGVSRWRFGMASAVDQWRELEEAIDGGADVRALAMRRRILRSWVTWYLGEVQSPSAAIDRAGEIENEGVEASLLRRFAKQSGEDATTEALIRTLGTTENLATAGNAYHLLSIRNPNRNVGLAVGREGRERLVSAWREAAQPLPSRTRVRFALLQQRGTGWEVVTEREASVGPSERRGFRLRYEIPADYRGRPEMRVPATPMFREPLPHGFSFSATVSLTHAHEGPAIELGAPAVEMRSTGYVLETAEVGPRIRPLGRVALLAPRYRGLNGRDVVLLMYATADENERLPKTVAEWRMRLAADVATVSFGTGTHKLIPADPEQHAWSPRIGLRPRDRELLTVAATLGLPRDDTTLQTVEAAWLPHARSFGVHVGSMLRIARLMSGDAAALRIERPPSTDFQAYLRSKHLQQFLDVEPSELILQQGWAWWRLAREAQDEKIRAYAFRRVELSRPRQELSYVILRAHAEGTVDVPQEVLEGARNEATYEGSIVGALASRPGGQTYAVALWLIALSGLIGLAMQREKAGGFTCLLLVAAGFGFLTVDLDVGPFELAPDALGVLFLGLVVLVMRARYAPRYPLALLAPWALSIATLAAAEFGVQPQQLHLVGLALFALGVPVLTDLIARAADAAASRPRRRWRTELRSGPVGKPVQLLRRGGLLIAAVLLVFSISRAGWVPFVFGSLVIVLYGLWGRLAGRDGRPVHLRGSILLFLLPALTMNVLMWMQLGKSNFPRWDRGFPDVVSILLPAVCLVTLLAILTQLVKLAFVPQARPTKRSAKPA
ncbi:MAG: serine/threonine-protein kinase [Planctomycetota bacterium]|nr:serine/threonine-protein kinase [Planctomycetota bacterium]